MASRSTEISSYRSSELAKLCDVSKDTLRYYERMGLLAPPARSPNGYRHYSQDSLQRVRLIRSALAVGFSVEELAKIFAMRRRGDTPCRKVREMAASRLADIERILDELGGARDLLRKLISDWDEKLERTGAKECAGLLESLASSGVDKKSVAIRLPQSRRRTSKGSTK